VWVADETMFASKIAKKGKHHLWGHLAKPCKESNRASTPSKRRLAKKGKGDASSD
jgi:hypothetical protein